VIAIVDYGAGNLLSVRKALDYLGYESVITADAGSVLRAEKIVVPGVGHFAATVVLEPTGLASAIRDAIARGKPLLGICLGMQWLFESSEEAPGVSGLGLFPGACRRFPGGVKSPHVGWNELEVDATSRLLCGIRSGSFVYYSHSYRAPVVEATVARSDYGGVFAAAVERENVYGVQFHPEKSGAAGLQILRTFCSL
jgi:glutamine amidotransferase